MRKLSKLLTTGCFFLCLGGWVYNGRVRAADLANQAVAQAVSNPNNTPPNATTLPSATATPVNGADATPTPTPTATPVVGPTATPTTVPAEEPKPAESTNLNSAVVNVGVDGMVEQFNAQDLDINTALHFLSLQSKRNIIASKEVKGTITANLYNVTFTEALDSILKPNGFDYIEKGNFIYVYTEKELEDIKKRDRHTTNRIYHLHYMTAQDAAVLIKPMLSSNGVMALTPPVVVGLPEGLSDTGGMGYGTDDTLVINDFAENLGDIDKALKDLDVRPKQVLIESTILNASLSEDTAMGVDFISLSGVNFANLLGGSATNVAGTSGSTSGTTGSTGSTGTTSTPLFGSGGAINNLVNNGNTQSNIGTNFASKVPDGGLSVGFLSNNIAVYVRALEEITDTTIVANPKILALNKHKGEVFIGKQFGYKTSTVSQTTTTETVEFLDTGTKLVFRPFIGDDGYVRMEVHPEDSSGGLDANSLPQKTSTEVTSNMMIKDGRTIVIGGLFREITTAGRGQVPVLGNIPILGVPFRQTADSTERTETIVLITPHIINDDTSAYTESEKEAADVRRMMLGNRAGLQPFGRDRIAQFWYAQAQQQVDAGCKDKALMYTDWALNTNPRFIEAIKLRESLTGKKVEEADSSAASSFIQNVLKDDAATTPDTGSSGHYLAPETPTTLPATR